MNRREMIAGLGAVVVGGATASIATQPARFTQHIRSKVGDIGSSETRVWLDGREITKDCRAADTELGEVEVMVREPVFHIVRRFGTVRVEVAGKAYPS